MGMAMGWIWIEMSDFVIDFNSVVILHTFCTHDKGHFKFKDEIHSRI